MDALYELRIVDGPVAVACWVLAFVGAVFLVGLAAAPQLRRWGGALLILARTVAVSAVVTGLAHWLLVDVLNVFPEDLPPEVLGSVSLARWKPAGGLLPNGELRTVQIPAPAFGFKARPAYVYLPPAYFAPTRPEIPVLLLISGQPGNPSDWLLGGRQFAARRHDALALFLAAGSPGQMIAKTWPSGLSVLARRWGIA